MDEECMVFYAEFDFREVREHDAMILLGICLEGCHIRVKTQGLVEHLVDGFDYTDIRMAERMGSQVLAPGVHTCRLCLGCTAITPRNHESRLELSLRCTERAQYSSSKIELKLIFSVAW
jgi:hypothetical protein